jgi:hypothetical protein
MFTHRTRTNSGVALISIIVLAACSLVFMLALAAIVSQVSLSASKTKWNAELKTAAEVGLDYAIGQYLSVPNSCALDPNPPALVSVNSLPAPAAAGLSPGISVTIVVKEISPLAPRTDWTTLMQKSIIYNKQLDPANTVSTGFGSPLSTSISITNGGYRILESTATRNGVSRTIRSVLVAQTSSGGVPGASGSPPQQSFFAQPFFSNGPIAFSPSAGSLTVQGDGPTPVTQNTGPPSYYSYNLNVSTNTQASIGTGTAIQGNVNVLSSASGSSSTANINGGTVDGRLTSNGDFGSSVQFTPGAAAGGTDNVIANADSVGSGIPNAPRSGVNSSPAVDSGSSPQYAMSPAIQAPPGTPNLPTGNVSSGDYVSSGFDNTVSGSVAASYGSTNTGNAPMRMFISDNGNAVNMDTGKLATPANTPANFQVWYSGAQPVNVNLNGAPFSGMIYAPFAQVTISGTGNFTGGIVAGSINATNSGNITVANSLSTTGSLSSTAPKAMLSGVSGSVYRWVPVTWQELMP